MLRKISEIKEKLNYGDIPRIAKAAKVSPVYVKKILNGSRPANSVSAKTVIAIANRIISNNESLADELEITVSE